MNRPVVFKQKRNGEYKLFDFSNYYEVDDDGNIYSLDRYVKHPKGGLSFKKGKLCKQWKNTAGYPIVSLSKDGEINEIFIVHKIVAQAFPEICGEWFEGCHIDHINTNKTDCRAINLKICTEKENHNNPLTKRHLSESQMGRTPWNKGKGGEYKIKPFEHPEWWADWKKVKVISTDKEGNEITYDSVTEAANATGALPSNIVTCCRGRIKTSQGLKWRYTDGRN